MNACKQAESQYEVRVVDWPMNFLQDQEQPENVMRRSILATVGGALPPMLPYTPKMKRGGSC